MKFSLPLCALALVSVSVWSCAGTGKKVTSTEVIDVGIDEQALDQSVKPCDDFYQFACGSWLAKTEIPADRASWMRSFSEIDERNELVLRELLDSYAAGKAESTDKYADKLGAFWSSCMAEEAIESTALTDLAPLLKEIDQVSNLTGLAKMLAKLHKRGAGPLFTVSYQQDFKDATQVIGSFDQGGIGLPDRDYYTKDDPKAKDLLAKYEAHVKKIGELLGAKQAAQQAKVILKLETELARASLTRTERRDPKQLYHRIELAGLKKLAPRFAWDAYLTELGHPSLTALNVLVPAFFVTINEQLQKRSMPEWRVYLKWHFVHAVAPALTKAFVDEDFLFFRHTLQGTAQNLPRWKRCLKATDGALGEALAQPFVKRTFGSDGKQITLEMVHAVEAAMRQNLGVLAWMDPATRAAALAKLEKIANKIGFPDQWRNYDGLAIEPASFVKNVMAADEFELHRQLTKIGKPLDRMEWLMTPPTVNAYYDASMNEMVFPAGILQPPMFSRKAHRAVNFGGIGLVMGHELTHGFDDEGRQFDGDGNMKDWWLPAVNTEFEARAKCVVDQFDGYIAVGDLQVNGKLTLGENIADLGGLKLAYKAYVASRKGAAQKVAGSQFTDDQLFFVGFAQSWCGKRRDEDARRRVIEDPHSPPKWRVNGSMSNSPEFAKAFQCAPKSPMVREKMCAIW